MSFAGDQCGGQFLELVIELIVVQEYPIIVVVVVEAVFDCSNGLDHIPKVGIAREGDKGGIYTFATV